LIRYISERIKTISKGNYISTKYKIQESLRDYITIMEINIA